MGYGVWAPAVSRRYRFGKNPQETCWPLKMFLHYYCSFTKEQADYFGHCECVSGYSGPSLLKDLSRRGLWHRPGNRFSPSDGFYHPMLFCVTLNSSISLLAKIDHFSVKKTRALRRLFNYMPGYITPWIPSLNFRRAFDSAKNHKRQRRKRQSVTAKREKLQTPKFV